MPDTPADKPHYHGHRQRLRDRFLADGGAGFQDYELLEFLLTLAVPRRDTKGLAKALIEHFRSFAEVIAATPEALAEFGLSPASIAAIKIVDAAAVRLSQRQAIDRPILSSWQKVLDYCHAAMARSPTEHFRILFLDRKNKLIKDEVQQTGTVNHAPVYPREVMKRALELGASAIIMVHNHPSGDPAPSAADVAMTHEVRDVGSKLGVTLHDHLIIGREGHASLKALGLI
ncbi:MAG: RadC family protein [Gemmatimonas sp.]